MVTTRAHARTVVTEYGVAELFGRSQRERAAALIGIAHPTIATSCAPMPERSGSSDGPSRGEPSEHPANEDPHPARGMAVRLDDPVEARPLEPAGQPDVAEAGSDALVAGVDRVRLETGCPDRRA